MSENVIYVPLAKSVTGDRKSFEKTAHTLLIVLDMLVQEEACQKC